ncbi:MAG: CDP-alcohol phosphatidyltransferase family protein [Verrucomicrobiales bacterium]|nr:CDP-alcohol phosphatidyltransferase family protein [Verrucomicrobiales bacterium]
MTLANKVTIARILLIPIFVVAMLYYRRTGLDWHRWMAFGIFVLASASDALDGWIARRFNQRSQLGALLDPLADKLLLVAALILLSRPVAAAHFEALPLWLVATVLSRDALMILGFGLIHFTCGRARVQPHWLGKAATVLQMAVVVLALMDRLPDFRWWLALMAALVTGLSTIVYVRDGVGQLSASPTSGPDRPS